MLRLDIVDFIENFNSKLMQLTRFKILEFKGLFPLLCSTRFWGQPGEISLSVSCFFFCTHKQFTISLKYYRNRTYSCHLTLGLKLFQVWTNLTTVLLVEGKVRKLGVKLRIEKTKVATHIWRQKF